MKIYVTVSNKMYKRIAIILWALWCCFMPALHAQINIWEGTGTKRVQLTPYLVPGQGNMAVVVCPGGSYFWHDMQTEGTEVAQWLNQQGISAFVLRYRTAYVPAFITRFRYLFRGNRYPDPQDDLTRTLQLIRERAAEFGIDTCRIGAMGFSAGGHLVMSVALSASAPVRPRFVAAIYPVVSMAAPCTHKRSRRALLGDNKKGDKRLQDSLSIERHVTADCPPVFLVNCLDDPVVHPHNAELLDSALTAHHVPHQYIQYSTGGHGFGVSDAKGTSESREWKRRFLEWLKTMK